MSHYRATESSWRRTIDAGRAIRRAVVRRADAWLYGLDETYPEYDAYRSRPRRHARLASISTLVAGAALLIGLLIVILTGGILDRLARGDGAGPRPLSPAPFSGRAHDPTTATEDPAATAAHPSVTTGASTAVATGAESVTTAAAESTVPASASDSTGVTSAILVVIGVGEADTRHTGAIPSTSEPAAA